MGNSTVKRVTKAPRRRRIQRVPEQKNANFDVNTAPPTTGNLTLLSGIAQGTDVGQRVGNNIYVERMTGLGRVVIAAAVTTFSTARVIVLRDNENLGVVPALADILESTGSSVVTRSPKNFINRKRFTFLYDELFVLSPGTSSALPISFDMAINRAVSYRGTGNTVAAAAEGTLYLLLLSDETVNAPNISLYVQHQFTDV